MDTGLGMEGSSVIYFLLLGYLSSRERLAQRARGGSQTVPAGEAGASLGLIQAWPRAGRGMCQH